MFEGITPLHLLVVLIIALIILGPGKLPEVGAALGKSIREFRRTVTDVREATSLDPAPPAPAAPIAPPITTAEAPAATAGPVAASGPANAKSSDSPAASSQP
jgi:TatA/E family protein of Tat protein translocase